MQDPYDLGELRLQIASMPKPGTFTVTELCHTRRRACLAIIAQPDLNEPDYSRFDRVTDARAPTEPLDLLKCEQLQ